MKLANIVTVAPLEVPKEFNVVKIEKEIDTSLPTLIIGYDYVNKHYPDFDITDPKLSDNLYWTFKRNEKRDKYQEVLSWFIKKTYEDLIKDVKYLFVDPIQYKPRTLRKIIRKINGLSGVISYRHKTMVYIYADNFIFGIDLKLFNFIGLDSRKILGKIKKKSDVFLNESDIIIEYKNIIETLDNKVRYIPYLFSINDGKNNNLSNLHIPRTP